ncbi:hypothetical protein J3Q64DRAFT_1758145 [Phycomyces blakesleeanus]
MTEAYEYDIDLADSMVEKRNDDLYTCKSFSTNDLYYRIRFVDGILQDCRCSDPNRLCKHIFLVGRVFNLPHSLPVNCSALQSSGNLSVGSESDTATKGTNITDVSDHEIRCKEAREKCKKYIDLINARLRAKVIECQGDPHELTRLLNFIKTAHKRLENYGSVSEQSGTSKQT